MKLTKEKIDLIVDSVKEGNYIEVACQSVGISKQTYYNWMKNAEELMEGESTTGRKKKHEALLLYFFDSVKKAHAEAELKLMKIIKAQSFQSWQAAAWILERTRGEKYGRRDKIAVTVDEEIEKAATELAKVFKERFGVN